MAKKKVAPKFWGELLSVRLYKRNQGRLTRQVSAVALALILFYGAWTLSQSVLSGYVNTFFNVKVTYQGTEADPAVDDSVREIVASHGGSWWKAQPRSKKYEIELRFPASRLWSTDQEIRDAAEKRAREFQDDVLKKHAGRVQVSDPRSQSRQAGIINIGIPLVISFLGAWGIFRAVNFPQYADFLISVEAEIDKVSWAGKQELIRSTIVVVTTMFFLGFVLFAFDIFWQWFFKLIHFIRF